jgi:hypothetical protein
MANKTTIKAEPGKVSEVGGQKTRGHGRTKIKQDKKQE